MMKFDHQSQLLDRFPVEDGRQEENPLVSSKLRIKLKVKPETTTGDDHKDDDGRSDWICTVCSKGFRSSKALGGHMRVHMEQQRALSKGNGADDDDGPPTCSLCKKSFKTPKSLFGHMRCHPERQWRGMHPPVTAKAAAALPLEDQEPPLRAVADGWPTKARRGRLSTAVAVADDEDDDDDDDDQERLDFNGAVYGLMLLSTGKDCYRIHPNHADAEKAAIFGMSDSESYDMSKLYQLEAVNYETNSSMEISDRGKKRKREITSAKSYSCSICSKSFQSPQALGGHTSSAHNKVLIRNELRHDDANNYSTVKEDCGVASSSSPVHICRICHKSFPSGQALGGHKRCHWSGPPSPEEAQAEPPLHLPCTKRELPGFDLNEIPADHDLIDQEEEPTTM